MQLLLHYWHLITPYRRKGSIKTLEEGDRHLASKGRKNPLKAENYHGITLMCCLGKLLERMVKSRVTQCLEKYDILTAHQCGYRRHHSTTGLSGERSSEQFHRKQQMVAVFSDFEKAFDKTWRYNFMHQLHDLRFFVIW